MQLEKNTTQYKITLLIMYMSMLSQAATALYLPSFPEISLDLNVSATGVKNTITIFLIGSGLSQVFYGPLSDRYGRKPLLLIGIAIFCLGCFINLFSRTQNIFLFARLLQGIGISGALIGGRSILRDCFCGRDLASAASYASMGFAVGFGISPIIGGYLSQYMGWQANFIFLLLAGLILFFVLLKFLPETSPHLEKNTNFYFFLNKTLLDYKKIISNRSFLQLLLGGLFGYIVIIAYNIMTPFLIQKTLGYSTIIYGWLSLFVAFPYYIAASINRRLVLEFGTEPIFIMGALLIVLAGLIMAMASFVTKIYLPAIIVPIMIATFGQALIFANSMGKTLHIFSAEFAGKVSALFGSLQILLAAIFSAIMSMLPDTQLSLAIVIVSLGLLSIIALWNHMKKVL